MKEFCIHYPPNGMGGNTTCKAGVVMKDTLEKEFVNGRKNAPCWTDEVKTCELAQYPTPEQIAEREKWLNERLDMIRKFTVRETDVCFHCGKKVSKLRQVGRCVYGSCGCRMWQGKIPKEWLGTQTIRSPKTKP